MKGGRREESEGRNEVWMTCPRTAGPGVTVMRDSVVGGRSHSAKSRDPSPKAPRSHQGASGERIHDRITGE